MNDIRQIKLIAKTLTKEKEKYLNELSRLNETINSKISMIDKMQSYQNDYLNNQNLNLSKSIPGLNKNINMFVKKIDYVIEQAKNEINSLKQMKSSLLNTIEGINRKIDLMDIFETKSQAELKMEEDKNEQRIMDDITSTMHKRREHE